MPTLSRITPPELEPSPSGLMMSQTSKNSTDIAARYTSSTISFSGRSCLVHETMHAHTRTHTHTHTQKHTQARSQVHRHEQHTCLQYMNNLHRSSNRKQYVLRSGPGLSWAMADCAGYGRRDRGHEVSGAGTVNLPF